MRKTLAFALALVACQPSSPPGETPSTKTAVAPATGPIAATATTGALATKSTAPASLPTPTAVATAPSPRPSEPWLGKYTFTWTEGKSVVGYVVTVTKSDRYRVELVADGTQTMVRMSALGTLEKDDTLTVTFDQCGKDDMFQCKGYKKGDVLFRLEKKVVVAGDEGPRRMSFAKLHAPDEKTASLPMDKR